MVKKLSFLIYLNILMTLLMFGWFITVSEYMLEMKKNVKNVCESFSFRVLSGYFRVKAKFSSIILINKVHTVNTQFSMVLVH